MRVDLPDGQWADLRDSATHRDRKAFVMALDAAQEGKASKLEAGFAIQDATVAWFVTGWSFPAPIPSDDPAGFDDLDAATAAVLVDAVGAQEKVVFPQPGVPSDDPQSPSPPSNA